MFPTFLNQDLHWTFFLKASSARNHPSHVSAIASRFTIDPSLPFDPNQCNDLGKETVIYRIPVGEDIQGLTGVYSDGNVRISKRSV